MRIGLLAPVFFVSVLGSSVALAGPITGMPADLSAPGAPTANDPAPAASASAHDAGFTAGSLFDHAGTPLLRTYGPYYVQPGARNKLRFVDGGTAGDSGSGGSGSGSTGTPGTGGPGVGNLNPELPIEGGADPLPGFGGGNAIPEPATLLLLVPAAALALRRRAQARG